MKRLLFWTLRVFLPPLLVFALAILALELTARHYNKPYLVPRPIELWRVIAPYDPDPVLLADGLEIRQNLLQALWGTTKGALLGYAASIVVGTLAGGVLATSVWIRRAFYPYTLFFQTVPIIAIAPLLVIWFSYDIRVVIVSAFIASVFPVIANTLAGLLSVDPALRDLFRLYGASHAATALKLRIPAALPSLFTGYRIAGGLAVIGAIVGEFVSSGSRETLGGTIDFYRTQQNTPVVFTAVLLASLLGLAIFAGVNLLSLLLLRHPGSRST